jgi:predicted transcriptional regulator
MAALNIYVSRERDKWLRDHLEGIARDQRRSLSFIVEEALVEFVQRRGKKVPSNPRKDHRSRATE